MAEEFAQFLTWDSVLALLASDAPHSPSDRLLWRLQKRDRTINCYVRELRSRHFAVGLEIRVEHNGQVYLTEVHKERVALYRRVEELRRMLEAQGWLNTSASAGSWPPLAD